MIATANPIPSSAAASNHAAPSPSLELLEARRARDVLTTLLAAERTAAAEFLLALADFDRRRGWERLGHASLFAFLNVELGLSKGAAYVRFTAARLLHAFPEVIEPIRSGRLCLSAVGELARVATPGNFAVVLPRFFGCSSREAREVAAAVQPRAAPPLRDQITRLQPAAELRSPTPSTAPSASPRPQDAPELPVPSASLEFAAPATNEAVRAHELDLTHPARGVERRDSVEPLAADLRRLHITVDAQFLKMVATARDGLSHTIPGASMEQVLKAALELLLEKQARARGLVKRPRTVVAATPCPTGTSTSTSTPTPTRTATPPPTPTVAAAPCAVSATAPAPVPVPVPDQSQIPAQAPAQAPVSARAAAAAAAAAPASVSGLATISAPDTATATVTTTAIATAAGATDTPPPDFTPPLHRRTDARRHVPAATVRAVWQRDGGRCAWPLDGGGVCGSTHRLELDHIVPWARWGGETADELRVVCHAHNTLAARQAFGERCMARYSKSAPGSAASSIAMARSRTEARRPDRR